MAENNIVLIFLGVWTTIIIISGMFENTFSKLAQTINYVFSSLLNVWNRTHVISHNGTILL